MKKINMKKKKMNADLLISLLEEKFELLKQEIKDKTVDIDTAIENSESIAGEFQTYLSVYGNSASINIILNEIIEELELT